LETLKTRWREEVNRINTGKRSRGDLEGKKIQSIKVGDPEKKGQQKSGHRSCIKILVWWLGGGTVVKEIGRGALKRLVQKKRTEVRGKKLSPPLLHSRKKVKEQGRPRHIRTRKDNERQCGTGKHGLPRWGQPRVTLDG